MPNTSTDRIEKHIELHVPVSRAWRALTDYKEFNAWFGVALESPFVPGETTRGNVTCKGYEHLVMEIVVREMQPERVFSFTWQPCCPEMDGPGVDEPDTLVEFRLAPADRGTLLRVVESGFDAISPALRDVAWRRNEGGWTQQMKNIEQHVTNNQ